MNGRTAKRLRKESEAHTVGMPARKLLGKRVKDKFGRQALQARNDPRSTRGMYLYLKRGHSAA